MNKFYKKCVNCVLGGSEKVMNCVWEGYELCVGRL